MSLAEAVSYALADEPEEAGRSGPRRTLTRRELEVAAHGQVVRRFHMYTDGKTLVRLELARNGSRFGFMLDVPQDVIETILRQRVSELGGDIEQGTELRGLSQDPGGVTATVSQRGGILQTITADYAVGPPGHHRPDGRPSGTGPAPGRPPDGPDPRVLPVEPTDASRRETRRSPAGPAGAGPRSDRPRRKDPALRGPAPRPSRAPDLRPRSRRGPAAENAPMARPGRCGRGSARPSGPAWPPLPGKRLPAPPGRLCGSMRVRGQAG